MTDAPKPLDLEALENFLSDTHCYDEEYRTALTFLERALDELLLHRAAWREIGEAVKAYESATNAVEEDKAELRIAQIARQKLAELGGGDARNDSIR